MYKIKVVINPSYCYVCQSCIIVNPNRITLLKYLKVVRSLFGPIYIIYVNYYNPFS